MYCTHFPLARKLALTVTLLLTTLATAQTYKVLHSFGGPGDGYAALGTLVRDDLGNLYGETDIGPSGNSCTRQGCGTVYQLTPNADGTWNEKLIHVFTLIDGGYLTGNLARDGRGNLFGVATCPLQIPYCSNSGFNGGVVFELTPQNNGRWSYSVPHRFSNHGTDGAGATWLNTDPQGGVFGDANAGGSPNYNGLDFTLTQAPDGSWTDNILIEFGAINSPSGTNPYGPVAFDSSGNVYGTTRYGGASSGGVGYKLSQSGGSWAETVLTSFSGNGSGNIPNGITFGPDGNLYGTTQGRGDYNAGTVYELTPNADGTWTYHLIYSFQGTADGRSPSGNVTFDSSGNIYGATSGGGRVGAFNCWLGCGTLYKLTRNGDRWTKSTLHLFDGGALGSLPSGEVVLDSAGNVYGVAAFGGTYAAYGGLVYEITP